MDSDLLPKPTPEFPGATKDGYDASITESRCDAIQTDSDRTLIEAVLVGDASQFESLVQRYSPGIYRFLLKHAGSAAIAEDLAQETFVEAYRHLASFKGESKFSTWLYGLALNRLRNSRNRSPDRHSDHLAAELLVFTTARDNNPIQHLEEQQRLLALQRAITDLPPELREVIMLVALEELSYQWCALAALMPSFFMCV